MILNTYSSKLYVKQVFIISILTIRVVLLKSTMLLSNEKFCIYLYVLQNISKKYYKEKIRQTQFFLFFKVQVSVKLYDVLNEAFIYLSISSNWFITI